MLMAQAPVKKSDITFLNPPGEKGLSNDLIDTYKVKWTGWGYGFNFNGVNNMADVESRGARYMGTKSLGVLLKRVVDGNSSLEDARCFDVAGNPVDASGGGFNSPFYRMCHNDPAFQSYLRNQITQSINLGCEGIHFDEPTGGSGHPQTWYTGGGCSCDDCNGMFVDYLKEKYTNAELQNDFGIPDINNFNYFRDKVRPVATTRQQFLSNWASIPFIDEFVKAQHVSANQVMRELASYTKENHPNSYFSTNAWHLEAYLVDAKDYVDFIVAEMKFGNKNNNNWANNDLGRYIVPTFRLAEGMDLSVLTTATINDWEFYQTNPALDDTSDDKINLSKLWIASAYATGSNFMVPVYYDWTTSHYIYGQYDDYGPVYQFIHENPTLFDEYKNIATVGILYDNSSAYQHHEASRNVYNNYDDSFRDIAALLVDEQIQFGVELIGGGTFIDDVLDINEVQEKYDYLVVPEYSRLLLGQDATVDQLVNMDKAMYWTNNDVNSLATLKTKVAANIDVTSDSDVWILPRNKTHEDGTTSAVLHLITKLHNINNDVITPQSGIDIEFDKSLLEGQTITEITAYAPEQEAVTISFTQTAETASMSIPSLDYWAIVEIKTSNSPPPACPSAPAKVVASNMTSSTIKLSWEATTGEVTGYEVYLADSLVRTTPNPNATIRELACNTSYSFKVRATYQGCATEFSSSITASTTACTSDFDCPEGILQNADFSMGPTYWENMSNGAATSSVDFSNGELTVAITDGGSADSDIQVMQENITLSSGTEYTVSFQASSSASRNIACIVQKADSSWLNYYVTSLSADQDTYSFSFFTSATEDAARLVFYLGGPGTTTLTLDNICLVGDDSSGPNDPGSDPDPTYYFIRNRMNGKSLSPISNEAEVTTQLSPLDWTTDQVQWEQIPSSNSYFYLKNRASGKFLRSANNVNGSMVMSSLIVDNLAEWTKVPTEDNFFFLQNRATDMYIRGISDDDYAAIEQVPSTYTGERTQWTFEEVSTTVSIDDQLAPVSLTIYPVPATHKLYLDHTEAGTVTIFSMDGKVYQKLRYQVGQAIDVSQLASGLYGLRVSGKSGKLYYAKMIKY